jgi:hypothetical protein
MSKKKQLDSKSSTAQKCPICGAFAAIPIVYGYPSPKLLLKGSQGQVALGGCITMVWELDGKDICFDPDWRCTACTHKWQDEANRVSDEDRRAFISPAK